MRETDGGLQVSVLFAAPTSPHRSATISKVPDPALIREGTAPMMLQTNRCSWAETRSAPKDEIRRLVLLRRAMRGIGVENRIICHPIGQPFRPVLEGLQL